MINEEKLVSTSEWAEINRKLGKTLWDETYPDYYSRTYDWQSKPGMVRCGFAVGRSDEHAYVYQQCKCGKGRFVRIDRQDTLCKSCAKRRYHRERGRYLEIEGELRFRNGRVLVWNGNHEVDLFTFLASFGLKDKNVKITVEKTENDMYSRQEIS